MGAGPFTRLAWSFHPEQAWRELQRGHTGSGYTWKGEEVNGEGAHASLHASRAQVPR